MLREGGLEQLVAASTAMGARLRCNGVWAMQNLAHAAPLSVKSAVLAALPWPAATALLSDPEPDVQVPLPLSAGRQPWILKHFLFVFSALQWQPVLFRVVCVSRCVHIR